MDGSTSPEYFGYTLVYYSLRDGMKLLRWQQKQQGYQHTTTGNYSSAHSSTHYYLISLGSNLSSTSQLFLGLPGGFLFTTSYIVTTFVIAIFAFRTYRRNRNKTLEAIIKSGKIQKTISIIASFYNKKKEYEFCFARNHIFLSNNKYRAFHNVLRDYKHL
jgi:hypothetical protein